jgi:hypothetical protein
MAKSFVMTDRSRAVQLENRGYVGHFFALTSSEHVDHCRMLVGQLDDLGVNYHIFDEGNFRYLYVVSGELDGLGLSARHRIRRTLE